MPDAMIRIDRLAIRLANVDRLTAATATTGLGPAIAERLAALVATADGGRTSIAKLDLRGVAAPSADATTVRTATVTAITDGLAAHVTTGRRADR